MALKHISLEKAQKEYGIHASKGRFYLRDDGCVVDARGYVRYHPPLSVSMSAESYALLERVHEHCLAFLIRFTFEFRDGECESSCPFHPSNHTDGDVPMCTTEFIRANPGKVREILENTGNG